MNLLPDKKKEIAILIFLFTLTIFLRVYRIQETFNFNAEYNYKLWAIKEVAYEHKLRLIGIEAVSYLHHLHYPPLMLYIFSLPLLFTQANPISIEYLLIMLNGINVILIYFFIKNILGKNGAFLGGTIYALSFFVQRADRFIWVVGPIIAITLSFLLIVHAIQKQQRKRLYFFILGLVLGLGVNFHFQAAIFLIPSLIILYVNKKEFLLNLSSFFSGLLPFVLPLIIFEFRHSFYNTQGILILLKDTSSIASESYFQLLAKSAVDTGKVLVKIVNDNLSDIKSLSILSFILIISASIFLIRSKRLELFSAGILIISSLLVYPNLQNRFYSVFYYLYFLIPVIILLIAWFLTKLLFSNKYIFFTLLLAFLVSNLYLNMTFNQSAPLKDQQQAIDWITNDAGKSSVKVKFTHFPSDEYSFLFYHSAKKYNLPHSQITFSDPWNKTGKIDYIMSSTDKMSGTKEFGRIAIIKIYDRTK